MKDHKFASLLWTWLLRWYPRREGKCRSIWEWAYALVGNFYSGTPVAINIHGRKTYLNFGHAYPLFARRFPNWNDPLIELVFQTHRSFGIAVNVVDVGAGVGDTVLLIESNCPGMVRHFRCIEGDDEFYNFLKANFQTSENVHLHKAMLAADDGEMNELVRHHAGSSAAQGTNKVGCVSLDSLLKQREEKIHVLKIDVDGLDGQVLAGARNTIIKDEPSIIFEWHPLLCSEAGYGWIEHFEILVNAGYERFVWFDKYGNFSHFTSMLDKPAVKHLAEVCINNRHHPDWHYDIVALPRSSSISEVALAELECAKQRRSWY